jgi:L-fucose isomerase-like protein
MLQVADAEAQSAFDWVLAKGMSFDFGENPEEHLTREQVLEQMKMYIAAGRIAEDFGCDMIGIQYQQGLKDTCVASDLAEGLLNNVDRPPIAPRPGTAGGPLRHGNAIVHFNEVDEGAAVDAMVTNRVWRKLGLDPGTSLHDVRYGEDFGGDFVWVMEISGSVPPSHIRGGYAGCVSQRQPPMYFPRGGGTIKGVSRAGWVVWSRVFIMDSVLHADLGLGECVELPAEEEHRRSEITTPQWPTMNLKLFGITRDQFMARHRANHVQVAYGDDQASALRALQLKAAMFSGMGLLVHLCGEIPGL